MFTITFPTRYLAALLPLAATKDVRKYLNGIGLGRNHLTATTGQYGGAIYLGPDSDSPHLCLPHKAVKFYLQKIKAAKAGDGDTTLEYNEETKDARLYCGAATESFKIEETTAVDLLRVVPDNDRPTGHAQFPWYQLELFEKAAVALGATKKASACQAVLMPRGPLDSARILLPVEPRFEGVISPIKPEEYASVYKAEE